MSPRLDLVAHLRQQIAADQGYANEAKLRAAAGKLLEDLRAAPREVVPGEEEA